MDYRPLIDEILGEHTEREGEVASLVLAYVSENPQWERGVARRHQANALEAMSRALLSLYGKPLEYYRTKSRERGIVETRQLAWLVLRRECGCPANAIAKAFGKTHATILYGVKQATWLVSSDKYMALKCEELRQKFMQEL